MTGDGSIVPKIEQHVVAALLDRPEIDANRPALAKGTIEQLAAGSREHLFKVARRCPAINFRRQFEEIGHREVFQADFFLFEIIGDVGTHMRQYAIGATLDPIEGVVEAGDRGCFNIPSARKAQAGGASHSEHHVNRIVRIEKALTEDGKHGNAEVRKQSRL